jgi:hypothetical protein
VSPHDVDVLVIYVDDVTGAARERQPAVWVRFEVESPPLAIAVAGEEDVDRVVDWLRSSRSVGEYLAELIAGSVDIRERGDVRNPLRSAPAAREGATS